MAVIKENIYVLKDTHAEILLPKRDGSEAARALIDLGDVGKCKKYRWFLKDNGYVYASTRGGRGRRSSLYLHRFIMNPPSGLTVDHINRDKLDNRKSSLRIATRSQNNINKPASGVRKKILSGGRERWQARIKVNQKEIHIGIFNTRKEALIARAVLEESIYGDFAFNKVANLTS